MHIAELLKNVIIEEIDGLCKCSDCYANAHAHPDDWFTMVCSAPHIVAWAKFQGCNFWPVKVMSAVGKKLSVRFFGDHTHADIAATKCYLFSTDSPAGKAAKTRGGPYKQALQVCSTCLISSCSGHYVDHSKSIPFHSDFDAC